MVGYMPFPELIDGPEEIKNLASSLLLITFSLVLPEVMQTRPSSNGGGLRRVDREMRIKSEGKVHSGKPASNTYGNFEPMNSNIRGLQTPSRDRLIYVSTCLIGHMVEVHVKNGSVFSGIFHAIDVERDFGIVLKMARIVKDDSVKGQPITSDMVKRPQTVIIPGRELIQVVAKDLLLTGDEFSIESNSEKGLDLMIDSSISMSHRVEERELERWIPDNDDPLCPELDDIFDGARNRNWDQFRTNEALFGVKSTFNEEIYTTRLERGPQMRDLERRAERIAREIEGEDTEDLHLAEERGVYFQKDFDIDEETRFSAVHRVFNDNTSDRNADSLFHTRNAESFRDYSDSVDAGSYPDTSEWKIDDVARKQSSCLQMGEIVSQMAVVEVQDLDSRDQEKVPSETRQKQFAVLDGANIVTDEHAKKIVIEKAQLTEAEGIHSSPDANIPSSEKRNLSTSSVEASSHAKLNIDATVTSLESTNSSKTSAATLPVNSLQHPVGSTTSNKPMDTLVSESSGLSPSSSLGSLTSEKSTLNPYAKEFKFNPRARSFVPSSTLRPQMPVMESPIYYATGASAFQYMPGLPLGGGIGPSYSGHQPITLAPQPVNIQSSQAFVHGNAALYGQQVFLNQPRPVVCMPAYHPDMQYKGRDF